MFARIRIPAGLLVLLALAIPAHGDPADSQSPPGQVLVVTENLQEAFGREDLENMHEATVFARRLIARVPYLPDVVILQEVRRKSARRVAQKLRDESGASYSVVLSARVTWRGPRRRAMVNDTAVVMNTDTMKIDDGGGWIATRYPKDVSSGPGRETRHHAYTRVQEVDGGLRVGLTSLHYVTARYFDSKKTDRRFKFRWSRKLADHLAAVYPSDGPTDVSVVAGDFNRTRCDQTGYQCEPTSFWKALTEDYGYTDAIWTHAKDGINGGVDYIFTTGGVVKASGDWYYEPERAERKNYYSDHRFRWALITARSE